MAGVSALALLKKVHSPWRRGEHRENHRTDWN